MHLLPFVLDQADRTHCRGQGTFERRGYVHSLQFCSAVLHFLFLNLFSEPVDFFLGAGVLLLLVQKLLDFLLTDVGKQLEKVTGVCSDDLKQLSTSYLTVLSQVIESLSFFLDTHPN